MNIVTLYDLPNCDGKHPASSAALSIDSKLCAIPDEEASAQLYIPADGISAALISPHRILVTGGVATDERVLPFTVLRYLDVDPSPQASHQWTKPVCLRNNNGKLRKRKKGESATFPVCRMDHTLTLSEEDSRLYLIGGMKVGEKEGGEACRTMFRFDLKKKAWESVEPHIPASKVKMDKDSQLGPRFAHSADYVSLRPSARSRAKPTGFIYIIGGYTTLDDPFPQSTVHAFDVKRNQWRLKTTCGVEAPQRGYHATSVSPCGQYLVLHGGIVSDFLDALALSDDFFLFHLQRNEWMIPDVHEASQAPPSARKRHSIVRGVGKHDGSLVLYGGFLEDGVYSNDLFTCRLVEPTQKGGYIAVVWEKIDLRTAVPRPLPEDSQNISRKNLSNRTSVAGGCLIALPALGKYIMVGGRGNLGIRSSPLMLDPDEPLSSNIPEGLATVQVISDDEDEEPQAPARKKEVVEKSVKGQPNSPLSPQDKCNEFSDEEPPIQVDPPRNPAAQAHVSPSPEPDGVNTRAGAHLSSFQPTPSDTNSEMRHTPNRGKGHVGRSPSPMALLVPSTAVARATAVNVRSKGKKDVDSRETLEEVRVRLRKGARVNVIEDSDDTDMVTPPAKRQRLRGDAAAAAQETEDVPIVVDVDAVDLSLSCRSEFVTSSELARRGKMTQTGRGRGNARGNGRARGRGKGRVTIASKDAELDVAAKKIEAAVKEANSLKENLAALQKSFDGKTKECLEVNEQVQQLLGQKRMLDNEKRSLEKMLAEKRGILESQNESVIVSQGRSEDASMLQSRIAELMEEKDEMGRERDTACEKYEQEKEDRERLQGELSVAKNKYDRVLKERDAAQKLSTEHRRDAEAANEGKMETQQRLRRAEEGNLILKRENEGWKQEVREAKRKISERDAEIVTSDRLVKTVKEQLAVANRKYIDHETTERRLQGEVERCNRRIENLEKEVEELKGKLGKEEDCKMKALAERDGLQSDFQKKLKEQGSALKDSDKLRDALEREKKQRSDVCIELTRVKRELERERKRNVSLKERNRMIDARMTAQCAVISAAVSNMNAAHVGWLEEADDAFEKGAEQMANGIADVADVAAVAKKAVISDSDDGEEP